MPGIHFQLMQEDQAYIYSLKALIQGRCRAYINYAPCTTSMDAAVRCMKNECEYVVSTSEELLQYITKDTRAKLSNYAGSIIQHMNIPHLFIAPLKQLRTVPYGKFLAARYLKKFLNPSEWLPVPTFEWTLFEPAIERDLFSLLETSNFIAVDIETDFPDETRCIMSVAFTCVRVTPGRRDWFELRTFVIPFTDDYNITIIRRYLQTSTPKIFQNGKYDIAYLLRFACPPIAYFADTANLFHSWYSELPKDLGSLGAFFIRDFTYWKDESDKAQRFSNEAYQYNAKDTYATALSFLAMMVEMPEFAIRNFEMEFPVVYPCILSETFGIKIDTEKQTKLHTEIKGRYDIIKSEIQTMVAGPGFNPKSPQQVQRLWTALGSGDIKSTDKTHMDKVKHRHPLNMTIIKKIEAYRELFDADTKYIGKDFVWHNRCFYSINPHGTDTSRLASKESHFNCGLQIQNIKRDSEEQNLSVKELFIADEGFYLFECDYKQNETWSQAYTSGDPTLIKAIEDVSTDFHGRNASQFFGIPYDQLVKSYLGDDGIWHHKKLNKTVRDLSKRTNHGASYNMAAMVLLDTMGIENVMRAKKLLNLNPRWKLIEVCQYLLDRFDETYPVVRGAAYEAIKLEIAKTGKMTGATGWTRVCFSDPNESGNKRAMNMYAAHKSQSLSAQVLNKAYVRIYNEVWKGNENDYKLHAQIHDSVIGQYRIGRIDLVKRTALCMDIHTPVVDIFGKTHDLNVPVDIKADADRWSELKEMMI